MTAASARPTSWWLATLRKRAERRPPAPPEIEIPLAFGSDREHRAALKFWNAAYRAEESGLAQAHVLARAFQDLDPELAETLRLYGDEEGWHRELLVDFLERMGGSVQAMGRVTSLLYRLYAKAERMDTILLTNLMFETIGSTTYRIALGRVPQPAARAMLEILTRDESFHVPLNVHFLSRALAHASPRDFARLRVVFEIVFVALVLLPLASRRKSGAFDRIGTLELCRAYARELGKVFAREPLLPFDPPALVLALLGMKKSELGGPADAPFAADAAAERERVQVTPL